MTVIVELSTSEDGHWFITIPALTLHVTTLELQNLIKWLNGTGSGYGEELEEAVTAVFTEMLPLSPAPCRWKGCGLIATTKVTVNTINGDMTYDLCADHERLVVPA